MSEVNYQNDQLSGGEFAPPPKLPTGLNVLTILTIIWCILTFLGAGWGLYTAKANFDKKGEAIAQMSDPKVPAFAKAMMPDPQHFDEMMTKSYENRIPIFLLSVVAIGLCFVGALQMRKQKKQGYILWLIGELLPFATTILFIGAFMLSGIGSIIGTAIVLLFVLLYTLQRKNLIY